MPIIRVEKLSKTFRVKQKQQGFAASVRSLFRPVYVEKSAVHDISFAVEPGETVAFLGPNGAGKSTTIKMLTGILHPSGGQAEVIGCCPWKERKKLAFMVGTVFGQKSQLWYHLPPIDTFELVSRIYELRRNDYLARRTQLIDRFELGPYLNTPVRKLSLGERMRCEIVAALLHRPKVLFLDEPTIGLDVVVKMRIREWIRELNREEGTTLFLTSHDPGDVEQLCRRAIVINHGQIVLDDQVSRLKREWLTRKTIRLQLSEEAGPFSLPGVSIVKRKENRLTLSVDTSVVSIEDVLGLIVGRFRIVDMTVEDPPMEEVIRHIYDSRREAGRETE